MAGRSKVLDTNFNIERIAITDPEVAEVVVVQQRELLINGKKPGTISLWVWGEGHRIEYELVVDPAVTDLQQQFQSLFPGEDIQVSVSQGAVLLSGRVSSNDVMLRAAEIAQASSPDQKVINLLQLPGGSRQPAGHAAGPVRRSEQQGREGAGRQPVCEPHRIRSALDHGAVLRAEIQTRRVATSGLAFADLLNLFFFQHDLGSALSSRRSNRPADSRASPSPT